MNKDYISQLPRVIMCNHLIMFKYLYKRKKCIKKWKNGTNNIVIGKSCFGLLLFLNETRWSCDSCFCSDATNWIFVTGKLLTGKISITWLKILQSTWLFFSNQRRRWWIQREHLSCSKHQVVWKWPFKSSSLHTRQ